MEISNKLKERFCKDCNIPLRLYQEPYFTSRLILYDKFYNTLSKGIVRKTELYSFQMMKLFMILQICVKVTDSINFNMLKN